MDEIVLGATRKILQVQIIDPITNAPLVFGTGPTVSLQAWPANDGSLATVNTAGTIHDSANAICWWTSAGTLISTLNGKTSAVYNARVKVVDGSGTDWGPLFQFQFSAAPSV